jgi:hypothetical protein
MDKKSRSEPTADAKKTDYREGSITVDITPYEMKSGTSRKQCSPRDMIVSSQWRTY